MFSSWLPFVILTDENRLYCIQTGFMNLFGKNQTDRLSIRPVIGNIDTVSHCGSQKKARQAASLSYCPKPVYYGPADRRGWLIGDTVRDAYGTPTIPGIRTTCLSI